MGFYDPYSKSPNIGGGINDLVSQLMQILMMKKMFSGQQQGPGAMPGQSMGPSAPMPQPQTPMQQPGGMPNPSQGMGPRDITSAERMTMTPRLPWPDIEQTPTGGQGGLPPALLQILMAAMQSGAIPL